MSSPLLLLLISGFAFACKIMIAKAALLAGILPFQLGVVTNLGAGIFLLLLVIRSGQAIEVGRQHLLLYVGLGFISFAIPTLLSYAVVDRVGPAYTSTVYSLSPILTMSFAAGLGVERMFRTRFVGVLVGFVGMVALVHQQLSTINGDEAQWVMLGLLIPAFAATGNIIRTKFWPKGTSALAFACATLLTSSVLVAIMAPVFEDPRQWIFAESAIGFWLICSIAMTAVSYVLNFRLQRIAGPVVFSQIGYWGSGFGVLMSALLFDDVLSFLAVAGVVAIVIGGVLANKKPVAPRTATP